MRILLDPKANIDYIAFYISGLYEVFGKSKVSFAEIPFRGLPAERSLKFVWIEGSTQRRFVIDWSDGPELETANYDWCDWYGKINIHTNLTPSANHNKLVALAPSFGIRLWLPVHIHMVSGEEDTIREAITLLINNPEYKASLEKNAHAYYHACVSPVRWIRRLTQMVW